MSTLTEVINAVCDDLNRNDMTAQCSDAVVMAIRHYDRKPWWFSQGSATFNTSASATFYPLASDFREMDYVETQISSRWSEVTQKSFPYIKSLQQSTGYPCNYALYDDQMHLGATPNGAYAVRYYYQKSLTELTAAGSNAWTTDGEELIKARAARKVAKDTLHDYELASGFQDSEDDALNALTDENERRTMTGKIKPHY